MQERQTSFFDVPPPDPKPAPLLFAAGSETSKAAANAARPHAARIRKAVYDYIRSCGGNGCTDEELCAALSEYRRDSLRPRRFELTKSEHVEDSGRQRETTSGRKATVWITTDKPLTED
jgi:hypothetical protein